MINSPSFIQGNQPRVEQPPTPIFSFLPKKKKKRSKEKKEKGNSAGKFQ
jgi:hypothetical protein